jgi:hypothetical protein
VEGHLRAASRVQVQGLMNKRLRKLQLSKQTLTRIAGGPLHVVEPNSMTECSSLFMANCGTKNCSVDKNFC